MIDKIGRAALFAKNHFKTAITSAKELKGKGISKVKEFKGKGIHKAKALKTKIKTKHAKIASDFGVRKGSFAKDFAGEVRREGRLLRKNVTLKNIGSTAWNYPITTGAGAGLVISAALPKKDKKKKRA